MFLGLPSLVLYFIVATTAVTGNELINGDAPVAHANAPATFNGVASCSGIYASSIPRCK